MRDSASWRQSAIGALVVCLSIVASLAVAETAVRIYKRNVAFQPDAELIRSRRPHVREPIYSYETPENLNGLSDRVPDKPRFVGISHTNNLGFRMQADVRKKAPGERRVLLLGDSYTEAVETVESDRFSHRSEQILKSTLPGDGTYRVVNLGIQNGSPSQYILMLRKYLIQLDPDVVVVVLGANDHSDDPLHRRANGFVLDADGFPIGLKATSQLWLLQRSYLLRYFHVALSKSAPALRDIFFPPAEPEVAVPFWAELLCRNSPESRVAFENVTGRYLLKLRDMVESLGAQFGVLPIHYSVSFLNEPYFEPESPGVRNLISTNGCSEDSAREYQTYVEKFLTAKGVAFVDLYEPMLKAKREQPKRKLWNFYDYHFSAAGHEIVASQLAGLVKRIEMGKR